MILFSLQILCSMLFATGLLFTLVDLRTRYDKTFRYFGLSLIFLSCIAGIDLWIQPDLRDLDAKMYWQRVLHVLACGFVPFSYGYLCHVGRAHRPILLRGLFLSSLVFAALFFLDGMLKVDGDKVVGGPLYYGLFFPYILLFIGGSAHFIFSRFRECPLAEKRILRLHAVGFLVLCFTGILDMSGVVSHSSELFPSWKILGILAFGIMASLIFSERFLMLLRDRDATFAKLESAYRDLEQVNALKQIGESTAIINHEIRNYMFMISGNAQVLEEVEVLSPKGKGMVRNIVTAVERLSAFSDDILKLSRMQVIKEKHPVNLTELVKGVVDKHFPGRRGSIVLQGMERDHFMFGDWGKLEQVFVNLFNNSFEAGNGSPVEIRVKITDARGLMLVSVEDNGAGCDKEQIENLFKAFWTTKKSKGGTGLGMSITRAIVESHGGKISAYSKNLARKGDCGLKLIMTFPIYAQSLEEEAGRKYPAVLVKEGMDNLADVIRIFQNVKVVPRMVQSAAELDDADFAPDSMTVLVSAKTMASQFTRLSRFPKLCLVSHHEANLYVLDYGRGNRPEVFSEEYVISRIIRKSHPRAHLRERQVHIVAG
ncbi:MAG TPA: HAMP domain-containing sensor histidine kinase [Fibrobacteria bacterium]|nr:HAMP domain-containing sensor histidine kinase [Fibrobacteria bacterium]